MLIGKKIRLIPTEEQEILFRKSCGVARWAYNYYLGEKQRVYNEWKQDNSKPKNISAIEVQKYINNKLKPTTHQWLKEVGSQTMKQGVLDVDSAFERFFSGLSGYPKFKSKHKSKMSFYTNYSSCKRIEKFKIQCEKLGIIKTSEEIPELKEFKMEKGKKKKCHYSNPRISYDGKYWYLSFSYNEEDLINYKNNNIQLTDNSLGIDLGLKDLVIVSNQNNSFSKKFKNINKSSKIKKLEKRLKREQRKLSRKLLMNIDSYEENNVISDKDNNEYKSRKPFYKRNLKECKNIQKQNQKIRLIYKKLRDIRTNHIHQITSEIVKIKPFQVVMENLNISGLMKNKHSSKSIQNAKWYFIRQCFEYKCKRLGINFILVDTFYPSSKTCSNCGNIKRDLKLKDRIYICPHCGLVIDRDINASINLSRYNLK